VTHHFVFWHSYYFVEGHALNDKERLAKVAADTLSESVVGQPHLTEEEILSFLKGDEGRLEIENALRALQHLGVHGIPKFIIEGSRVVDGAAEPETFIQIFREIEKRGKVARGPLFGEILGISQETLSKGSHTRESMLVN
jgi:predicted DsbA family dithiol-disulfide isomerase